MKSLDVRQNGNRREFLLGTARCGALSLLAVLTGLTLSKARGENCRNQGPCEGCPALADCRLPRGISARRTPGGS
jgi:hypothetical protein